jgi:hypothetical protein
MQIVLFLYLTLQIVGKRGDFGGMQDETQAPDAKLGNYKDVFGGSALHATPHQDVDALVCNTLPLRLGNFVYRLRRAFDRLRQGSYPD